MLKPFNFPDHYWQKVSTLSGGRRAGLGDLPFEVIILVFSFLRAGWLLPLRLVCRAFRQASVQYITGLRMVDSDKRCLADAMRVFPGIATLTIEAPVPVSIQDWPQSDSKLSSRIIHDSALQDNSHLPALLAHLSGLTSLTILNFNSFSARSQLRQADVVASCPGLRSLEAAEGLSGSMPVRHWFLPLTALSNLKLSGDNTISILPRSPACLSLLRSLADVLIRSSEDLASLGTLTQLTALGGSMRPQQWVVCLLALTGLRRFKVGFLPEEGGAEPDPDVLFHRLPMIGRHLCSFCICAWPCSWAKPVELGTFVSMTWLERLGIGLWRWLLYPRAPWSMEGATSWCHH